MNDVENKKTFSLKESTRLILAGLCGMALLVLMFFSVAKVVSADDSGEETRGTETSEVNEKRAEEDREQQDTAVEEQKEVGQSDEERSEDEEDRSDEADDSSQSELPEDRNQVDTREVDQDQDQDREPSVKRFEHDVIIEEPTDRGEEQEDAVREPASEVDEDTRVETHVEESDRDDEARESEEGLRHEDRHEEEAVDEWEVDDEWDQVDELYLEPYEDCNHCGYYDPYEDFYYDAYYYDPYYGEGYYYYDEYYYEDDYYDEWADCTCGEE